MPVSSLQCSMQQIEQGYTREDDNGNHRIPFFLLVDFRYEVAGCNIQSNAR